VYNIFIPFLQRAAMLSAVLATAILSVCLYVCPSVTCRYVSKRIYCTWYNLVYDDRVFTVGYPIDSRFGVI